MELINVKKMRGKQIAVTNGLILILLIFFFSVISVFDVTFSVFFFVLGVFVLIQAVIALLKGNSTKSFIPIFEQVANYEKQKMGREWTKQRKMGYIWQFILSGFMFLQYYMNRDSADYIFHIDLTFMFVVTLITMVLINIGLLVRFRKVDHSTVVSDFKGYTWKSNVIAIVVGVMIAFVLFAVILFYAISTIPSYP